MFAFDPLKQVLWVSLWSRVNKSVCVLHYIWSILNICGQSLDKSVCIWLLKTSTFRWVVIESKQNDVHLTLWNMCAGTPCDRESTNQYAFYTIFEAPWDTCGQSSDKSVCIWLLKTSAFRQVVIESTQNVVHLTLWNKYSGTPCDRE